MATKTTPRRGRPAGSKDKAPRTTKSTAQLPQESGIAYVYDQGFVQWSDPTIDLDKIKQMMRNPYFKKPETQLMNLLFPHGDLVITVQDQDEHSDEMAAKKLRQMYRTPDCNIKKLSKKCWLSWFYHGPFVYNIVYDNATDPDGWYLIKAIRHLPAETFSGYSKPVNGLQVVSQSELLPGISRYSDGNIYYTQSDAKGQTTVLKDVRHEAPPNDLSGDPAGMPICYVVLGLIEMLNFAWACQKQRLQRVGAPSIFLTVENAGLELTDKNGNKITRIEYANNVLQNWGRNNMFPLLEGMTAVPIPTNESDSAMETINALAKLINDQWSPIGLISTEGSSKIGGGDNAGLDLLRSFRSGFLDPVAELFVRIGEEWLSYNGFLNYSVFIKFPEFNPKNDEIDLRRAQEGRAARTISRNEHREYLGLERATEEDLERMDEEWGVEEETDTEVFPGLGGKDNLTSDPKGDDGIKDVSIDENPEKPDVEI